MFFFFLDDNHWWWFILNLKDINFLTPKDSGHFFKYLLVICMSFFENCLSNSLIHYWLEDLFEGIIFGVLYWLFLCQMYNWQRLSPLLQIVHSGHCFLCFVEMSLISWNCFCQCPWPIPMPLQSFWQSLCLHLYLKGSWLYFSLDWFVFISPMLAKIKVFTIPATLVNSLSLSTKELKRQEKCSECSKVKVYWQVSQVLRGGNPSAGGQ